jgi:hypothetical protein
MRIEEAGLWLLIAHFFGDWWAQNDWVAQWKGKSWLVMLAHCMIYTGFLCIALKWLGSDNIVFCAGIIFFTHFVCDEWKCLCVKNIPVDKFPTWHVYFDQFLHLAILGALLVGMYRSGLFPRIQIF